MTSSTNADMPAMPLGGANIGLSDTNPAARGLTKREHFAVMAVQGLMSAGIPGSHNRITELIPEAIAAADALLKALEDSSNG